ncbi:MAG: signal recognition particle-docking protein FtsY [Luteibaculum sp.]
MGLFSMFKKADKGQLEKGIEPTKTSILDKITRAVAGKSRVDNALLDELEEALISADVSVETTLHIIDKLEERIARDKYINTTEFWEFLKDEIAKLLDKGQRVDFTQEQAKPYVILVVGVNGVGKTTTIGKIAHQFKSAGKKVCLGAADTFRAAAINQLKIWGERVDVPVIAQEMGSDPASVAYDAVSSAVSQKADVVIIDTAGRLHNKSGLMAELGKIKRVISKVIPDAPHETLLVLDASTGQNAIEQAKQFTEVTQVNAIALTKLDGTAKGGVVIGISHQFDVPVKYIGIGEQMDDLQLFVPKAFADSLFEN